MKPMNDYSFVRGVCHNPPRDKDWERSWNASSVSANACA